MRAINLLFLFVTLTAAQSDPFLEGLAQFERGEYTAAAANLEKAVQSSEDPRARTFLALSRAALGRCEAAISELKLQFEKSNDTEVRRLTGLGLAQCHLSSGQFSEAFPILLQLKALYASDPDVLYQTAKLHMRAWNGIIGEMFEKAPASFRVNQLSAEIFEIQGKYAEAVSEYRKAIAKNPKALNLHFRLGRALLMDSHSPASLAEALIEFAAELNLNPNDAVAEYQMGQILLVQQKREQAAKHLERAVKLYPRFPEALIALGKAKLDARENDEAIRLLEQAVQIVPQSEAARYSLMLAYRNTGRAQDALREKAELEKLQKLPEGEFTEFLKKLGEKTPRQ